MEHSTPGISLSQFVAAKPKELRLGQWFVNCYVYNTSLWSQWMYQLDGAKAKQAIESAMMAYQWDTLPEFVK